VQEQNTAPKDGDVIRDCCKACVFKTYRYFFSNDMEEYLQHDADDKQVLNALLVCKF